MMGKEECSLNNDQARGHGQGVGQLSLLPGFSLTLISWKEESKYYRLADQEGS